MDRYQSWVLASGDTPQAWDMAEELGVENPYVLKNQRDFWKRPKMTEPVHTLIEGWRLYARPAGPLFWVADARATVNKGFRMQEADNRIPREGIYLPLF